MQFKLGSNDWAKIKLSPDGAHLLGHWRQGDTICRILDGHALPPAVWLKGHQPEVFEAEALNRIGWLERSGRQVSVVLTDLQREERLGPFDDVSLGSDCFSTDGQHFTFAFEREGSWWVWVDGRELGPYTTVRKPALYGRTLVFAAYRDPRYTMWIGDQEYDVHEGAFSPQVAATLVVTRQQTPGLGRRRRPQVHRDRRSRKRACVAYRFRGRRELSLCAGRQILLHNER